MRGTEICHDWSLLMPPYLALVLIYGVMSVVSFGLYWMDKGRARTGRWRISEATLHASEMFGGWPGAWVAQRVFRHKWQKGSYMLIFWTIVAAHVGGWLWFVWN